MEGEPPAAYVDLVLCRDVYHCTPKELARQDATTVAEHLALLGAEAEVKRARARK